MTFAWGWPLAWTALAALLVPLLLHLDRRRALRPLRFAALRWIGATQKPQRTLRLREWLLLLLRLLLLAAVVAWLAQPLLHGTWSGPREWLVVAPGVDASAVARAPEQPAVWLAPGFPALEETHDVDSTLQLASLLREFDAQLHEGDRLRVVVPREIDGLDAEALALAHPVEWQIDAGAAMPMATHTPPLVAVRYADEDGASQRTWRALVTAWNTSPRFAVRVDEAPQGTAIPDAAMAVVWFGDDEDALRPLLARGRTVLQVLDAETSSGASSGMPTHVETTTGTHLRLDHLDPSRHPGLRDPATPARLHAALFGPAPPPTRADAAAVAPRVTTQRFEPPPTPLRPLLAALIAVLFLVERVLASGRRLERAT